MISYSYPILVGEEEVADENRLLRHVEDGAMMQSADSVRYIILHCTATRATQQYTEAQLLRDHRKRRFRTVGYHFYVRRDGTVSQHRRLLEVGAHCRPLNRCSIGICYEGGLDADGNPADTRTPQQHRRLTTLIARLLRLFPKAQVGGHRDFSPDLNRNGRVDPEEWTKLCPCFDAREAYGHLEERHG